MDFQNAPFRFYCEERPGVPHWMVAVELMYRNFNDISRSIWKDPDGEKALKEAMILGVIKREKRSSRIIVVPFDLFKHDYKPLIEDCPVVRAVMTLTERSKQRDSMNAEIQRITDQIIRDRRRLSRVECGPNGKESEAWKRVSEQLSNSEASLRDVHRRATEQNIDLTLTNCD